MDDKIRSCMLLVSPKTFFGVTPVNNAQANKEGDKIEREASTRNFSTPQLTTGLFFDLPKLIIIRKDLIALFYISTNQASTL